MPLADEALAYLGLSEIVDASSGSFTDDQYSGCANALAQYLTALAAVDASCGAFAGLLVGEVPTAGLDTWATIVAGATCWTLYKTYTEKATALANCLSSAAPEVASTAMSQASIINSNIDQVAADTVALADQQGWSPATA
jgi:hypothetical protein